MEYLIKEYIKKITVDDIKEFAKKKNISITDTDAIILYTYAKNHYQDFLNGNDTNLIWELKEKLSPNAFKEAYKLYLEYKIKYLS
jgi:hypothetical protein